MTTNYFPNGYTEYNAINWGSESLSKLFTLMPDGRLVWVQDSSLSTASESLSWETDGSIHIKKINGITYLRPTGSDDTSLIQSALDAITVSGEIVFTSGTYIINTSVSWHGTGHLKITLLSGALIDGTLSVDNTLIQLGGSVVATSTLDSQATVDTNSISTPLASSLSAGDIIELTTSVSAAATVAQTLTASATGPINTSITLTAGGGTPFAVPIVGFLVKETNGQGIALVTARTNDTQVTATVLGVFSTLSVAANNWTIGDYWDVSRGGVPRGEMCEVLSVGPGNTVLVKSYLNDTYNVSTTSVRKLSMPQITIDGVNIIRDISTQTGLGLQILYAKNLSLTRSFGSGSRGVLVQLSNIMRGRVSDFGGTDFFFTGSGLSYGLAIAGCQYLDISSIRPFGGRHAITFSHSTVPSRFCILRDCCADNYYNNISQLSIDSHAGSEHMILHNVIALDGIVWSGRNYIFDGVMTNAHGRPGMTLLPCATMDYIKISNSKIQSADNIGMTIELFVQNITIKHLELNNCDLLGTINGLLILPNISTITGATFDEFDIINTKIRGGSNYAFQVQKNGTADVGFNHLRHIGGKTFSTTFRPISLVTRATTGYIEMLNVSTEANNVGLHIDLEGFVNARVEQCNFLLGSGIASVSSNTIDATGTVRFIGNFVGKTTSGGGIATPNAALLIVRDNDFNGSTGTLAPAATGNLITEITQAGKYITYSTAAPAAGTWKVGDISWNSAPAVGQPKGWMCTVAGTPGTWVSMGNL